MSRFKIGHTFQYGEQVTPQKLNNAVNMAEFGADAVDDTSIEVNIAKKLEVKAKGVTNDKLAAASVSKDKVQGMAITTEKLADSSVTNDKLAAGSVSKDKVQGMAITTEKLADSSVTNDKLAAASVSEDKVQGLAITNDKLAAASVSTSKIQSSAITTECIADGAITRDKLAENAMGIKSIQKGTTPTDFTSRDINIATVNPKKSFVILDGGAENISGGGFQVQLNPWVGSLTETQLNIRLDKEGSGTISWQVVEFY